MRLLHEWPVECLLLLAEHIPDESDLNALAQTNWHMYHLFNPYLYQQCDNTGVLSWAIKHTRLNTARYCLLAGADPNVPEKHDTYKGPALHRTLRECHIKRYVLADGPRPPPEIPKECAIYRSMVLLLLEHGADLHGRDDQGSTPVHGAAGDADLEMVRLLLSKGARLTDRDVYGCSLLYEGVAGGDEVMVRFLIEKGCDVNDIGTKLGVTPLHRAAEDGKVGIVALLLAKGANVDVRDEHGKTPLQTAVLSNAAGENLAAIIQLLVDGGHDIDAVDNEGLTPLQRAIQVQGQEIVFDCLVKNGANLAVRDRDGLTLAELKEMCPLHEWPTDCLLLITDHIPDCDPNALARTSWQMHHLLNPHLYRRSIQTRGKIGVLRWVIRKGVVNTARQALLAGADPNRPDDTLPALHWAVREGWGQQRAYRTCNFGAYRERKNMEEKVADVRERYRSLVLLLVDSGADIHGRGRRGWTPLHTAAWLADLEMVHLLVCKGASLAIRGDDGRIPLHIAGWSGDEKIVCFLLEDGSDVNAAVGTDLSRTPLHEAAEQGRDRAVALLLASRAKVDVREEDESTPLHNIAGSNDGPSEKPKAVNYTAPD